MLICLKTKTILKRKKKIEHFHRNMLLLKVGVVSFKQGRLFWKHGDWLRNVTLLGDPTLLDEHPSLSVFARRVLLLEWAPQLRPTCSRRKPLWLFDKPNFYAVPSLLQDFCTFEILNKIVVPIIFVNNFWAQHIKGDQRVDLRQCSF